MSRPSLTGLVLTYNGARLLEKCLRSLDFCDHLLVVDSNSQDQSRQIAEACRAKVLTRAWEGPAVQFKYAFEHIESKWVFSLDQDEMVSPELRNSILSVLESASEGEEAPAGYMCGRRSFYFDHFLRHSGWYPDRLPRLFRLEATEVRVSGAHYSFHVPGRTPVIAGDIIHYPYKDIGEQLEKHNYYTRRAAEEMHSRGRRGGIFVALLHAVTRFVKFYLLKRGFLDGRAGFILAVVEFQYAFLKYARLMELEAQAGRNKSGQK